MKISTDCCSLPGLTGFAGNPLQQFEISTSLNFIELGSNSLATASILL
jgi:hypothetical protein